MPVANLPFGEFLPDQGQIENPGLERQSGAIFYGGRWQPSPYVHIGSDPTVAITAGDGVSGFHIHSVEDSNLNTQTLYFYASDNSDIYRSTAANALTLTSATSALAALSATASSGIQFLSYGNQIIATDFNKDIVYASTPTTDFVQYVVNSAPTSYIPRARYLANIKQQVLIGHVKFDAAAVMPTGSALVAGTTYPSLVMWSADPTASPNSYRRFGDPASTQNVECSGSDYQILADEFGAITGLVGGDYAYIFKERAIYRMDGPPFTFRPVVTGTGTVYCNSIVKFYDDIYFWGPSGPTVLRAGSSVPELLGAGKISRAISDPSLFGVIDPHVYDGIPETPFISSTVSAAVKARNIAGFADYRIGLIGWVITNTEALAFGGTTCLTPGKVILYSINDNAFSYFYIGAPAYYPKTIPQYHYPNLFNPSNSTDYALSDTYFIGGYNKDANNLGNVVIRGFGTSPGFSTAATNTASQYTWNQPVFRFSFLPLPVGQAGADEIATSRILRVRPVYTSWLMELGDSPNGPPESVTILRPALHYKVIIRTTNRFTGELYTAVQEYTPTDSWQSGDGWLDIETTYGSHHQIEIRFDDEIPITTQTPRTLSVIKDFIKLQVEYDNGAGKVGTGQAVFT